MVTTGGKRKVSCGLFLTEIYEGREDEGVDGDMAGSAIFRMNG